MTQVADLPTNIERYESFQDVIDSARDGYVDLSYHNYDGHITSTMAAVPVFNNWAVSNGITDVPEKPLETVLSHHDHGVHIPLLDKGTSSDEVYAAQVLWSKLMQFKAGREIINSAIPAIVATIPGNSPINNFQLATRMLDVGNVCSDDFSTMLHNTLNVIVEEELELKSRITVSFIEKRDKIAGFLGGLYFSGPVLFTAEDGSQVEYETARTGVENVGRLATMSEKEFVKLVPQAEEKFAKIWPK